MTVSSLYLDVHVHVTKFVLCLRRRTYGSTNTNTLKFCQPVCGASDQLLSLKLHKSTHGRFIVLS